MKAIFALVGIVLLLLFSFTSFGKENVDSITLKNIVNEPQAIINRLPNSELSLKTYVVEGDGEVLSTLILKNNNEFALSANEYISYTASGKYAIDNEELLLTVTDDEVYVFIIDGDKLIFKSGIWLENWVEQDTVFYPKIENNKTN